MAQKFTNCREEKSLSGKLLWFRWWAEETAWLRPTTPVRGITSWGPTCTRAPGRAGAHWSQGSERLGSGEEGEETRRAGRTWRRANNLTTVMAPQECPDSLNRRNWMCYHTWQQRDFAAGTKLRTWDKKIILDYWDRACNPNSAFKGGKMLQSPPLKAIWPQQREGVREKERALNVLPCWPWRRTKGLWIKDASSLGSWNIFLWSLQKVC